MTAINMPRDRPLFTGLAQYDVFNRLYELRPSTRMPAAREPHQFAHGEPFELPETHPYGDGMHSTAEFLEQVETSALLVLKNGELVHEHYALTGGRDVQWISWSMSKSFVSALIGIAVAEGHIAGIEDPISDYGDVLTGSAYDGVRIKDVLQMSSGARWIEDYSDPESDVHRLAAVTAGDLTLDEFMATMVAEHPPGTLCRYNSADTQALGTLLVAATGRSISDYMHEKLVEPLGFEYDSHWLTDDVGMETAYGGLTVTARDYAKFGEMYRRGGDWHGTQVVPEEWVRDSLTSDAPHLQPGRTMIGEDVLSMGYGHQWWLYPGDRGDYAAIGVYNQSIHIDPPSGTVIVKLGANRRYGLSGDESDHRMGQHYYLFRTIAHALGRG